ncbi:RmlC-like cupin domain-containing protein [Suillus americanus]|nr:RmlC-like cupin domain-containing protein [Suillus americanus]
MASPIAPLRGLRVSSHLISSFNLIPNTSLHNYPLIIYHECFLPSISAAVIEAHLGSVGVVEPQWRYTMYSTTHFHSTTHEILCIASGRARLCFGGEDNPGKVETEVKAGDVIIIPAGVGHRLLQDLDGGFEMVGSYPNGMDWDMCYGREDEKANIEAIKDLAWFDKDPIYGDEGPALQVVYDGL